MIMRNGFLSVLFVALLFVGCDERPAPTRQQLYVLGDSVRSITPRLRRDASEAERQMAQQHAEKRMIAFLKGEDAKYDINKLTYAQLRNFPVLKGVKAFEQWILPVLQKLATAKHDSAVVADFLTLTIQDSIPYAAYRKLFDGAAKLVVYRRDFLDMMPRVMMDVKQKEELIETFIPYIDVNSLPENIYGTLLYTTWFRFIFPDLDKLSEGTVTRFREKLLTAYEQVLTREKLMNRANIQDSYDYFQTLYAQGKLIGSEAPALHFLWNSEGKGYKTLSDLKGKVVVLDFWATWCGPCVRAFPNVRKLQERYKGYPVVILGVTSVQGRHIDRSGEKSKTIDCKGDTKKEFRLMKQFMKDLNMTWEVAFAEEEVYNIDYGVKGIPHLAIIDATGKVRYNELHPGNPPYHEAEKIDALLKEAGLKFPKKPMEKVNYIKE